MSFFGLFGPPNIKRLRKRKNIRGLIKALHYQSDNKRRGYSSEDRGIHEAAAKALGEIGDPQAVEPLIDTLKKGSDWHVCEAAAEALEKIGWQPDRSELGAVYWIVKRRCYRCVDIGTPAVEPLVTVLKSGAWYGDKPKDWRVSVEAAQALGKIGGVRATEALIDALENRESERLSEHLQVAAAEALGEIGDTRAVELLIKISGDFKVRDAAIFALSKIGTPAVESLIEALLHKDWDVRISSAKALGQIGDARAVSRLVRTLTLRHHFSPENTFYMHKATTEALVKIGKPAVESLIASLEHKEACKEAAKALGKIGDVEAVIPLINALKSRPEGPDAIAEAAEALAEIGDLRAVEPLIATLKDKRPTARSTAANALDKLGWQPDKDETGATYWIAKCQWSQCVEIGKPAVKPLIHVCSGYGFEQLFRDVAGALAEIGDAEAVPLLIEALRRVPPGPEAATKALGQFGDTRAVGPLIELLKPYQSPGERRITIDALVKITGQNFGEDAANWRQWWKSQQ